MDWLCVTGKERSAPSPSHKGQLQATRANYTCGQIWVKTRSVVPQVVDVKFNSPVKTPVVIIKE